MLNPTPTLAVKSLGSDRATRAYLADAADARRAVTRTHDILADQDDLIGRDDRPVYGPHRLAVDPDRWNVPTARNNNGPATAQPARVIRSSGSTGPVTVDRGNPLAGLRDIMETVYWNAQTNTAQWEDFGANLSATGNAADEEANATETIVFHDPHTGEERTATIPVSISGPGSMFMLAAHNKRRTVITMKQRADRAAAVQRVKEILATVDQGGSSAGLTAAVREATGGYLTRSQSDRVKSIRGTGRNGRGAVHRFNAVHVTPDAITKVCAIGEGDPQFWHVNTDGELVWSKHPSLPAVVWQTGGPATVEELRAVASSTVPTFTMTAVEGTKRKGATVNKETTRTVDNRGKHWTFRPADGRVLLTAVDEARTGRKAKGATAALPSAPSAGPAKPRRVRQTKRQVLAAARSLVK